MTKKITLEEVLRAKEARRRRQERMIRAYGLPVASITINMPGAEKDGALLRRLRDYAVEKIKEAFDVRAECAVNLPTGPEAVLAVAGQAEALKAAAVEIEEERDFARLLDIDVFDADGTQLSRARDGKLRPCFICAAPAVVCIRNRSHSGQEALRAAEGLLDGFRAHLSWRIGPAAAAIGRLAAEAMLYEVAVTPSPGLVDRSNSGAHRDMDFYSFMAGSAALTTAMMRCAQAGRSHHDAPAKLLPVLRRIGREGEAAMLAATGGVNTQKGLLFSLGIAAAAAGHVSRRDSRPDAAAVLQYAAAIVEGIVKNELAVPAGRRPLTAGERLYRQYGITGIRGELENGLPSVRDVALPHLETALSAGLCVNDALLETLLLIILHVEDTTVMNRHDPETLRGWVRENARRALAAGGMRTAAGKAAVAALDEAFIERNVSPGGAADLLAVTWFLYRFARGAAR